LWLRGFWVYFCCFSMWIWCFATVSCGMRRWLPGRISVVFFCFISSLIVSKLGDVCLFWSVAPIFASRSAVSLPSYSPMIQVLLLLIRMRPNLSSIPMKHLMKLINGSTATC
jgi:hypothetical protein